MKLNYRILGAGEPLVILHGVFGSSDNWQSVGKIFADHFKVFLVDQRNHGNSPHSDLFNYEVMAEDVIELLDGESIAKANILGHSMGGKVAMQIAADFPDRVAKLIVVDIAPKEYPPHHQQIFAGFNAVKLQEIKSRKEADDQISTVISNIGVRQFILKNLDREKTGGFRWKLNINAIEHAIDQVGKGLEKQVHFDGDTLFIGGGNSDYITASDHALIHQFFPGVKITTIAAAGHWVHAEKPQELSQEVLSFLL